MATVLRYSIGCVLYDVAPARAAKDGAWVIKNANAYKDIVLDPWRLGQDCTALLTAHFQRLQSKDSSYLEALMSLFAMYDPPKWMKAETRQQFVDRYPFGISLPKEYNDVEATDVFVALVYYCYAWKSREARVPDVQEWIIASFCNFLRARLDEYVKLKVRKDTAKGESVKIESQTWSLAFIPAEFSTSTNAGAPESFRFWQLPSSLEDRVHKEFDYEKVLSPLKIETSETVETPIVVPPAPAGTPEKPKGGPPDPNKCCEELMEKLNAILELLRNNPPAATPPKDKCCDEIKKELADIHKALEDLKNNKKPPPPTPAPGSGGPGFPQPPKPGRDPSESVEGPDSSSDEGGGGDDEDDTTDGREGRCFIDTPGSTHSLEFKAMWEGVIAHRGWEEHLLKGGVAPITINAMKTSYADIIEAKHNLPCPAGFTEQLAGVVGVWPAVKRRVNNRRAPAEELERVLKPITALAPKAGQRRLPASHVDTTGDNEDVGRASWLEDMGRRNKALRDAGIDTTYSQPGRPNNGVSFQGPKPGPSMSALAMKGVMAALAAAGGVALSPAGVAAANAFMSAP